jgi:hypothetical protein
MTHLTYHIVRHDGGWAYEVEGSFSETFPSHDIALAAARRAAAEQELPGQTTGIVWEDNEGRWHREIARGDDHPSTDVEG